MLELNLHSVWTSCRLKHSVRFFFLGVKKAFFLVVRSELHTANYAGRFPNKRSLLATSTPLGVERRRRCISAEFKQIKTQGAERKLNSCLRKKCFDKAPTTEDRFEVWEMRHPAALIFIPHQISICRLLKMFSVHHLKKEKQEKSRRQHAKTFTRMFQK